MTPNIRIFPDRLSCIQYHADKLKMIKRTIDVKAGRLFPFHFLVLGGVALFAGLFMIVNQPIAGSVLVFIGLLIFTAHEGTVINPESRTIREYYSFFFLKTGQASPYETIESIAIHKAKISQKMFTAHTTRSSTFTHIEYRAYLKILPDEKILLTRSRNKTKLMNKVRKIAQALNISVVDHAIAG